MQVVQRGISRAVQNYVVTTVAIRGTLCVVEVRPTTEGSPMRTSRLDVTVEPDGSECQDRESTRAQAVLEFLSPRLINILAGLQGAPNSVTQATVQLLPFGSRAALESTGVAERCEDVDGRGHHILRLTPLGFEVIEEAASFLEGSSDVDDLEVRAARALSANSQSGAK